MSKILSRSVVSRDGAELPPPRAAVEPLAATDAGAGFEPGAVGALAGLAGTWVVAPCGTELGVGPLPGGVLTVLLLFVVVVCAIFLSFLGLFFVIKRY